MKPSGFFFFFFGSESGLYNCSRYFYMIKIDDCNSND